MQLTTLLTLLPLLAAVTAHPACDRPYRSRSRRPRPTRSSASAAASPAVTQNLGAAPAPAPVPSPASESAVASPPAVSSPLVVGGGNNAASSAAASPVAPASSAVVTTSRAPASSAAAAAPPATSSAAASAAPAPAPNGISPVGLAMNYESKANVASFGGDHIGWYYSWNLDPLPNTAGLEFVPMIWGADAARRFDGKLREGTTHVLGFNEPDIGNQFGGSNMDARTSADLHKSWTAKVPAGIKIGSPAVARGGKKWMNDWLAACGGGCKYDFVPYHFYGTDANQLIEYTKDFYATFQKPLWLTEVACHDYGTGTVCNAQQVRTFMNTFFTWARSAEGQRMVERWSWFGAFPNHAQTNANGILNTDGTANDIGKYYASL